MNARLEFSNRSGSFRAVRTYRDSPSGRRVVVEEMTRDVFSIIGDNEVYRVEMSHGAAEADLREKVREGWNVMFQGE